MTFRLHTWVWTWTLLGLIALCSCSTADAQTLARRATSPGALLAFPGFFQGQPVVVRGTLATRDRPVLISPSVDRAIPLLFTGTSPQDGMVELRATFWDVGRLQRDDPRISSLGLLRLLPNNGEGDWPRPGDVIALVVTDATAVKAAAGPPTIRMIALNPQDYTGQRVTVSGQFRGRNLFGDMPQAPGLSQWDFVLHNGDGSLWITSTRPRGKGFNLDVGARVDTRAWLEVTGTVRSERGLVWIEAVPPLTLAKVDTTFVAEALPPPPPGPRPEVIFTDPDEADTEVPLKKAIRLQFSRDMDPESFKGNVHWRYAGAAESTEELAQASLTVKYEKVNRSLEIRITAADTVTKFRNITLDLTDGVLATDGAKLVPSSLTFSFGGQ